MEKKEEKDEMREEKPEEEEEEVIKEEEKIIHVLDDENKVEEEKMGAERLENGNEVNEGDNKSARGEGKDVESKSQIDSPKKTKQTSKQNPKAKVTVPRPFNLATEKRMSRERRSSMDFKDSKPIFSKSASFNYRTSDIKDCGSSTRTTAKTGWKPKVRTDEKVEPSMENASSAKDKVNVKEVEKKKPQVALKKQEGEETKNKLRKASTFKALPLPSFYNQKSPPPKLETKKPFVTHSKPPLASQEGRALPKTDDNKTAEKAKRVSRTTLGTSAKEPIINKLFRSKSVVRPPKETANVVISSA